MLPAGCLKLCSIYSLLQVDGIASIWEITILTADEKQNGKSQDAAKPSS